MFALRTRFNRQIVAEFLPPARPGRKQKVIILCDGMPSIPRKQPLMSFLAQKGYWVFYPRYRGAWEAAGSFWRGRRTSTFSMWSVACREAFARRRSDGDSVWRQRKCL